MKVHNKLRKVHGISEDITQDTELSKKAQEWAERIAEQGKLEHSAEDVYGENLAFTCSSKVTPVEDAVMNWYAVSSVFIDDDVAFVTRMLSG